MSQNWLSHILLCGTITACVARPQLIAQMLRTSGQSLPAAYQKWLDEDVGYIITDEERAEFAKLDTEQQRDKFIIDFWQRRNPTSTPEANPFKEEHYRRLAYANQNFAASTPGWKTDRGRIYIVYGPPDAREQHPANHSPNLPDDASPTRRYATDSWRYHFIEGLGRNVFFVFVDTCGCGKFELMHDPTKRRSPRSHNQEKMVPVKQIVMH